MLYVVIVFLWAAILLYLLLGGADFGAGIIELFTSSKNRTQTRKILYRAIGPIWEANHMWLIIAIVILFVGFPAIYTTMSVNLHIPLTIMLLGIIARGTAFTFRHYDAVVDDMQHIYNRIFAVSSLITPLFLGIIAGSSVSRHIDPNATSFLDAYIFSWLHPFPVAVGLFTVAICGYLASIYLIGETETPEERQRFMAKAWMMNWAAVACGVIVFTAAYWENIPLIQWVFGEIWGILGVAAATISVMTLWFFARKGFNNILRILAGFQVMMILFVATYQHFPNIILLKNGGYLSLLEHKGDDKTIVALGWALVLGSLFILPFLIYLMYSFQNKDREDSTVYGDV
ncbi:cytochrome d ubiquinol oxidase subunit II [Siphonobacter sp. SORGH_AS_0500]|uniref:cytochrome d ubiquinol oxidase subunit II n=1 Tax=Siphonobacter sp. SORGH_AS_0500 TaxID=1864824 RepID=UPI00285524D9|nr:cytochrome d ubiquinol oxidase subunit II [Siphonobacter sp. SORGH_AS_0500]MDR6197893.1 cytochrome d ubiquinol oxidase subunit II [Siphonobacter sp. SORGH_AS_0500]